MIREILLACAGAVGFALLFRLERKKLWIVAVGSAGAWYGYLVLCGWLGNQSFAIFVITAFIVLLSGIISIVAKCPGILFSTPILIPFIPGAALYYVMYDVISRSGALERDFQVLYEQTGAMTLGILVAELGVVLIRKIYSVLSK